MFRFNNSVGQTGGDSSSFPSPRRRGRVRSADFGMPERQGLIDLARPTGNPSMAATVTAPVMSAAACDTTLAHLRSLGLVRLDDAEAAALTAALDVVVLDPDRLSAAEAAFLQSLRRVKIA